MESLHKLIEVFKLHYEKIILGLVLVGLAGAVWFLYQEGLKEEQSNQSFVGGVGRRKVKGLPPVDLSGYQNVLKLAQSPPPLNLSGGHNVFNPVKWQKRPDGTLLKIETGKEVGPDAMTITKITPLHFIISLDRAVPGGYFIGITREGADKPLLRRKQARFVTAPHGTNEFFTLVEIQGSPEDPTELVLQLADTKELVSIAKTKEYKKVAGYEADLKYPIENKSYPNQRVGATTTVAGDQYNIIAISENEVVLSARLNDKKYTVRQVAGR